MDARFLTMIATSLEDRPARGKMVDVWAMGRDPRVFRASMVSDSAHIIMYEGIQEWECFAYG